MIIVRKPEDMLAWSREQRSAGKKICLVPTMGSLHEGHLSLIRIAHKKSDRVIVSLFVNPTQFGPREDLEKYPRDEARDRSLCEKEGADVLFIPDASAMYPEGYSVSVVEESISKGLCGVSRPVHFRGVVTVVAKLFNIVDPDFAVFGEKDAQQLRVIRRLVRDLNYPIEIVSGPTVREEDGLAMSSRNKLLSKEERVQAAIVRMSLEKALSAWAEGEKNAAAIKAVVAGVLSTAPLGRVDYIELVDDETLEPVEKIDRRALLAIAVNFSSTRLIDNVVLGD